MAVATVLACSGDDSGGDTSFGSNATTGAQTTTVGTTGAPGTTGTPTTGDEPGTGSGGATTSTTSTTGDTTGTTGDATTGTTADATTGTTAGTTGGSSTGALPICGDGNVDAGEDCDASGESETCNADCTTASCGDGKINAAAGEVCDDSGESEACNADCTAAACGDGQINKAAGEVCDGMAPANASCDACAVACNPTHDDCNADLADGCEIDLQTDAKNCGMCAKACPNNAPCKAGKCVDVGNVFNQYNFENRTVYIYKSTKCADLNQHATFCQDKGLAWWKAKSQPDAQKLIDVAFSLDQHHTWIQVFGAATSTVNSSVDGFPVVVDSPNCVDSSADGWSAFRKWGCSFCEPTNNQNQSCCWDKDHAYDWFVCEG
jgi:hypothetical protein